jgi:hypothetical protein
LTGSFTEYNTSSEFKRVDARSSRLVGLPCGLGIAVLGGRLLGLLGLLLLLALLAAKHIVDIAEDGKGETCSDDGQRNREASAVSRAVVAAICVSNATISFTARRGRKRR